TSFSVQQISDRLGFQNQSHFGTFFKRQTGLNPSSFKSSIK
ncbi:MAG: AraC family transcriptional regulator, partial [Lachnospiraceae bacterium]|nr:AraC family transcriptional regulator [Lachnospiraceae bacterium]